MFLLIPIASGHRRKRSHFTFHDVSINTPSLTTLLTASLTLHSTMFLLILCLEVITQNHLITLHSTMFLLIPAKGRFYPERFRSLHSTMFLLIPVVYSSLQYRYNLTTFCQSCHFIIFILIFIFLDSSHF